MNKKGNNAWILCPSKSFPGKLYYFNVITGEAVWCLTEEEKKALAKDDAIKKVSDKSHTYPEPNTPPVEDIANTANMCFNFTSPPNIPMNYHIPQHQLLGQPIYSGYIPNQYMPGYVIPMPQMFVANKPEQKKRTFDQITQTSDIQVKSVHGYTIPLSERFGTYIEIYNGTKTFENKGISVSTHSNLISNKVNWYNMGNGKLKSGTMQGSVFGSKLNNHDKSKVSTCDNNFFNSNMNSVSKTPIGKIIKNPVLTSIKRREDVIGQDFNINNSNHKLKSIQNTMLFQRTKIEKENHQRKVTKTAINNNLECNLRIPASNNLNSTIVEENWHQNTRCEHIPKKLIQEGTEAGNNEQGYLNSNDLRFVLEAKRRKLIPTKVVTTVPHKDILSSTSQLNVDENKKENTKQVSFDLQGLKELDTTTPEESEIHTLDSENVIETNSLTPQTINISYLKSLAKSFLKTDPWYIIVDIGVLLYNFEFIEDLVKNDITCRILVPNSVRSYVETMSVGEYGGRSWVILARKAMRRLTALGQHVVLQPPIMEKSSTSSIDGTIECCLQVLECHHAVLITTDTELYNKGVSSGIHTYKLDDIKKGDESEQQVCFDMGINVKIENDNVFIRNTDEFESFDLKEKDHFSVNDSNIFKVPKNVKENRKKLLERDKDDTRKSFILDKINVVTNTTPSNKVALNRRKLNTNKLMDLDIEDDIKLLSLHDNTTQNSKLSDNLKGISRKYPNLKTRKIMNNTKIPQNNTKDEENVQNLNPEKENGTFDEIIQDSRKYGSVNCLTEVSCTSEFGRKAKSLIVTAPVNLQNTNASAKEGHRIKINAYTLEGLLKRFHVKDERMNRRIKSRLDEWVCCFNQIMEECLSDILMNNTQGTSYKASPPWTLLEAVLCLTEVYSNNTAIKAIADRLCNIISSLCDRHDNLKNKIKSMDFMKLFGCGVLLVETLKSILPQSAQVLEAEKLLSSLLHNVQDPSTDTDLPYTRLRVVSSEIDDIECLNRNIVPKKPSEIIEYLKRHFPAWKDFDESQPLELTNMQKKELLNEKKVFRTFGKQLNSIRINNAKQITFDNIPSNKTPEFKENIEFTQKELTKITRTADNVPKDTDKTNHPKNECVYDPHDLSIKFVTDNGKVTNYRTWKDSVVDDEILDYEEFTPNDSNFAEDDNSMPFTDNDLEENDNVINNYESMSLFNDVNGKRAPIADKGNCYGSTNDSGFVNESLDACSFIRLFLMELSASFKLIHNFIDNSIQEFRCDMVRVQDKKLLYDKANETHVYVADIIGKLRRIVDREASEDSKVKSLIKNAGVEALTDKRLTRYRQVTMKCLEQAQLLEGALKMLLALTNEHCEIATLDVDNVGSRVPYFNIFE